MKDYKQAIKYAIFKTLTINCLHPMHEKKRNKVQIYSLNQY